MMSTLPLILHPQGHSPVAAIDVALERQASGLLLIRYRLSGALGEVRIPDRRPPTRADGLWQHTCFEAFIGAASGYYEINLSPSTQWAAYRFDGYRAGMRDAAVPDPAITWRAEEGRGELLATLRLPPDAAGPLAISAVIEQMDGTTSYWALAHAPGPPDFHHAACFAAQLPPAD